MGGPIQRRLEPLGFGNFKSGEASIGRRILTTLDFDKPQDGRMWSCRYYFVAAGTLGYRIGFSSNAPGKIVSIQERIVQSFEVLRAEL